MSVDMRRMGVDCRRQRQRTRWPQLAKRDRAKKRVEGGDSSGLREGAARKAERDQQGLYTRSRGWQEVPK